jgi:uncharacterized protein with GYD domain
LLNGNHYQEKYKSFVVRQPSWLAEYKNQLKHLLLRNEQGIKTVKDSLNRLSSFEKEMENACAKITTALYTFGEYDGILIVEAPNDETLARVLLASRSSNILYLTDLIL